MPAPRPATTPPASGPSAERILEATLTCLRRDGLKGTSISSIAREAGLARPTIYAHFDGLEHVTRAAIDVATYRLVASLARQTSAARTPADAVVELMVAVHREFRADAVAMMVLDLTLEPSFLGARTISPAMMRITGSFVRPILRDRPALSAEEHLITETICRAILSILTYESEHTRSDAALRRYLHRTLVPALGLTNLQSND